MAYDPFLFDVAHVGRGVGDILMSSKVLRLDLRDLFLVASIVRNRELHPSHEKISC